MKISVAKCTPRWNKEGEYKLRPIFHWMSKLFPHGLFSWVSITHNHTAYLTPPPKKTKLFNLLNAFFITTIWDLMLKCFMMKTKFYVLQLIFVCIPLGTPSQKCVSYLWHLWAVHFWTHVYITSLTKHVIMWQV